MEIIDYIVVLIYLVFIIVFGVFLQRKASTGIESYFLGNRNLPWWVLGASGMASNTDLAGTMVLTALVYALGTKGFFIEIRGGLVLIMAFLMTFMGKWNRRAQVMTIAEWMKLRFGKGREGNIARIISAVANIIFAIGTMSYFAVGGGKFLGGFLGINDKLAGILLILLALIYTAVSGFYGVVLTDVFQGFLIFVAILYICFIAFQTVDLPETFSISLPGSEQLQEWSLKEWSSIIPPIKIDLPGDYSIFNLFGGVMLFYVFKVFLEGGAGGGGYMIQRYFAAKSDRQAGLLSLFWIFLLSFRWPLVTALAILGIDYGLKNQVISDPELVLPTVIAEYIPVGMKGLLIACFIAAAMSTFDSIINASAAYWVKDIYQAYLKPEASNQQLVNQGRLASIVIVGLGLIFSFNITNINDIWGWLTLGLGTGLFIPLVLRWYWWRFNGYGFAIGTGTGLIAAILTKGVILPVVNNSQIQEYILFLVPSICSFLGCILGTFFTPATNLETIDNFYRVTRPFGFWEVVRKKLPTNIQAKIKVENQRDIMATLIAIPWQLVLFLMGMMLMMKQWDNFGILLLIFILLSIGLYFTWFRYLDKIIDLS
ncbi:sodium:solute symporter [Okeania sp. SIO2B3]|uniref:sodium:solute symporter family transporter n=1 Tax=Okeania sp. SIO2B3 TaxID=2607784 RepID=UPI0013C118B8|nr:sodium:solute symporter [Okeania sp. SIO2B3]NET44209.1 sodium:solute symporter [Okeania sp. SIO2B3]